MAAPGQLVVRLRLEDPEAIAALIIAREEIREAIEQDPWRDDLRLIGECIETIYKHSWRAGK